jgi:cytochrome c oxidase subunit 2
MRRFVLTTCGLLNGCAGVQTPLAPASDQAAQLYGLWSLMLWVCGGAYLLVLTFLAMALWRARRRLGLGPQTAPDDAGLSRGLMVWVALIVLGLASLASASFLVDRALARADTAGALAVRVTGQQWWWRVEYRDPATGRWIETANELHLPLNQPARIELLAADVIHSFWIPNLSGKMDMIPGRANAITVTPRRVGWLRGQCAEFCGLQHAQMALDVKVETPEDFAIWLAAQARPATAPTDAASVRGQALVSAGNCGECHTIRGAAAQGRAGPDLTHIAGRRFLAAGAIPMSRGALMGWLAQPQALKPGAAMPPTTLTPADADAVSRYLAGLT